MKKKEIQIKKYVAYLFGASIALFILNKLCLRPWILKNDWSGFILILTNSLPNLFEAIIGTLLLMGVLLQLHHTYFAKKSALQQKFIPVWAVLIAAIYVISQELKFHNLGGNNVYDLYDLFASFLGLVGTFAIIQIFGFSEKTEPESESKA